MENEDTRVYSLITNILHDASVERLKQLSSNDEIALNFFDEHEASPDTQQLFSITLEIDTLKVVFECYFDENSSRIFSNRHDSNSSDNYAIWQEFCNLVGGALKNVLQDNFDCLKQKNLGADIKFGLPKLHPETKKLFFSDDQDKEQCWTLSCSGHEIICACNIDICDAQLKTVLNDINEKDENDIKPTLTIDEGGDFELL